MADCQTTGGYPRIAQVAAIDLPLCAQLKPGDITSFKEISWKEAEKLYLQNKQDFQKLALAIEQKYV
jgi:antagonist of KipI